MRNVSFGPPSTVTIVSVSVGCNNKCHRLGGLNNENLFSQSLGDCTSKIKVPPGQCVVRALA